MSCEVCLYVHIGSMRGGACIYVCVCKVCIYTHVHKPALLKASLHSQICTARVWKEVASEHRAQCLQEAETHLSAVTGGQPGAGSQQYLQIRGSRGSAGSS